MPGLMDQANGAPPAVRDAIRRAQATWQQSMTRQVDTLKAGLRRCDPAALALRAGVPFADGSLSIRYWGSDIVLTWPALEAAREGQPASVFDTAMLLYYLTTATGGPLADRWLAYHDLPSGQFYARAFQGYSGDRLARAFGDRLAHFDDAARALGGSHLPGIAEHAFAFQPLPRICLAAVLWPGDDEIPSRASVLFDAAACDYMTIDGLALLGGGLAGRMISAVPLSPRGDSV